MANDKHKVPSPSAQGQIVREERLEVTLLGRIVLALEELGDKDDKIILLLKQLVQQGTGDSVATFATLTITPRKGNTP